MVTVDLIIGKVDVSNNTKVYKNIDYYAETITVLDIYSLTDFINLSDKHKLEYINDNKYGNLLCIDFDNMSKDNLIKAIELNPHVIHYISKVDNITYDMYLNAARNIAKFLRHKIPEKYLTSELLLEAVKCDGTNINYITKNKRSIIIIKSALNNNGLILSFLDENELDLLDDNDYIDAVKNNIKALNHIPYNKRTKEFKQKLANLVCDQHNYILPSENNKPQSSKERRRINDMIIDFTHDNTNPYINNGYYYEQQFNILNQEK